MKTTILLVVLLFGLCSTALVGRAQTITPPEAPPDQELLTQRLATSMCQSIEAETKRRPLSELSGMESRELLWRALYLAMAEHVHFLAPFLTDENVNNDIGGDIGEQATNLLQMQCAVGKEVALKAGLYHLTQQQPTDPCEQKLLRQMATELCQHISTANADNPLATRSEAARQAVLEEGMVTSFKQHKAELTAYYGKKALRDAQQMGRLGTKISSYMAEDCPTTLSYIQSE
jgi:hypothetical protein